jgi:small conductance mechanosensitive channel
LRRLDVEFKLAFNIPFEEVKAILETTINLNSDLLKIPAHQIGVSSVDPDGYKIVVNTWVDAHKYQDIKLKFQEKMIEDLKRGGIKLPGM